MVFWTLCIEAQFYVVLCLLIWVFETVLQTSKDCASYSRLPFLGLFAVSLAWPAGITSVMPYPGSFVPYWHAFLAGAIVWWTIGHNVPFWTGCAALIALWAVTVSKQDPAVLAVALTATMLLASSRRGNLHRWLGNSFLQLGGRLSYCMYLVHVPLSILLLGVLARVAPAQEIVGYLFLALLLALTLVSSYVMHVLVEVPALRWSKRLKRWNTKDPA